MKRADTRKVRGVKDDTLIVAIDVGMEMNRGYYTTPDGRSTKPFKFDNTREGLDTFWGMVMALIRSYRQRSHKPFIISCVYISPFLNEKFCKMFITV